MKPQHALIALTFVPLVFAFQNCGSYTPSEAFKSAATSDSLGGNASTPDAGSELPTATPTPNPGPGAPKMIPVYMASGHVGRTIVSCDDGQTWIKDRSDKDSARCWADGDPNYLECDHQPSSGHGLDAGDGWFFANFGWGLNGSVRRSRDGSNWETLRTDGWGGGLAYLNGKLFLLWSNWLLSSDQGATWIREPDQSFSLDHAQVKHLENTVAVVGRGDGIAVSADNGSTWKYVPSFKKEWFNAGDMVGGNGIIVSVGVQTTEGSATYVGYIARSVDQGLSWTSQQVFSADYQGWGGLAFNGTEFYAITAGAAWKSRDGITWTKTPLEVATGAQLGGPVAVDPSTGTYVMIPNVWGRYYSLQKAYRSRDGIRWTELDNAHFKGGHPINNIVVGKMDQKFCMGPASAPP